MRKNRTKDKHLLPIYDLPDEKWVDIKGLEGYFQISSKSRFKRLSRKLIDSSGRLQNLYEKIMKPYICSTTNYKMIDLSVNRIKYKNTTHRLLAQHFIPNPGNKPEVNHKNGVRDDDRLDNLEWFTSSEQKIHSFAVLGRKPSRPYSVNPHLKDNIRREKSNRARRVIQKDLISGDILREYSCVMYAIDEGTAKDVSAVIKCCKGKIKHHNKFKWEYA